MYVLWPGQHHSGGDGKATTAAERGTLGSGKSRRVDYIVPIANDDIGLRTILRGNKSISTLAGSLLYLPVAAGHLGRSDAGTGPEDQGGRPLHLGQFVAGSSFLGLPVASHRHGFGRRALLYWARGCVAMSDQSICPGRVVQCPYGQYGEPVWDYVGQWVARFQA